jgi:hypothetical protein
MSLSSIDHEHADFQAVQYQLQRMLGLSSNIAGLNVWKISTPEQVAQFNSHVVQTKEEERPTILECFHPVTDHGALSNQTKMHQYIANIQSGGIPFPEDQTGVTFIHGALPDDTPTESLLDKKEFYSDDENSDLEAEEEEEEEKKKETNPDDEEHNSIELQKALVIDELKGGLSRESSAEETPETKETSETKEAQHSQQPISETTETPQPSFSLPKIRAYLIVSVLTGRPGSFPTKELQHNDAKQLPNGYNSICYPSESTVSNKTKEEDLQIITSYNAKFRIFSAQSVAPRYLVTFDREGVEGGIKPLFCDMCATKTAEVYCRHEDANLCKDCDKDVHSNKLLAKHKRVPLRCSNDAETLAAGGNNNLEIFKSKCPFHNNMDVEFFCPECDVPVCIYCKMVGSHSTGAFNNHRLIGVRVAWKKAIDEASVPNLALSDLNKKLHLETKNIRSLKQAVDENEALQIADIQQKAKRAIEHVRNHAVAKRAVLDSDKFALKRRAREAENLESFLELQKKKLLPVEFITFWGVHKRTRDTLTSQPVVRPFALDEVLPDIVVSQDEIGVHTTAPYSPYEFQHVDEEEEEEEEEISSSEEEEEDNENISAMLNATNNRRHTLINKRRRETIIAFDSQLEL